MVDREVVLRRLDHLEDNLNYLQGLQEFSKENFCREQDIYLRYERALHLAVEAVIDLGNHLIAERSLKTPEFNKEIFKILNENNIISDELADTLSKMAGFRNILVHDYLELDRELEYEIMKNGIYDLREFMKIVAECI